MKLVKKTAEQFINEMKLSIPVNLELICSNLNIKVVYLNIKDAYGYLRVEGSKKHIFISKKIQGTNRARFTIAHELGHYILGHDTTSFCKYTEMDYYKKEIKKKKEREADIFAAELLMPSKYIDEELENILPKDYYKLNELRERYEVSLISLLCKYVDVSDEKLKILYYKQDKILWEYGNNNIEIIHNTIKNINDITYRKDYLNKWCYNEDIKCIYELIIPQGDYRIVLLHLIEEE